MGEISNLDKNLLHLGFLGEYESTLDGKNRFVFPSALKKQYPEGETRFIISRGLDDCLMLYTLDAWKKVEEKLSALNEADPNVRIFKLLMLGGATEVELDSGGRLLMPQTLKKHASIEKEMMLVAVIDKVKIFNLDAYNKLFVNNAANFTNLAQMVNISV